MKIQNLKKTFKNILVGCMALVTVVTATGCGASEPVSVDAEGNYSFQSIDEAARYVIELYHASDVDQNTNTVNQDAKYVTRKSFSPSQDKKGNSTSFASVPFGDYVPVIYGIYSDRKTTTDVILGEEYTVGGTLSTPKIMVTNKGLGAIVRIKQNSMDTYVNQEAIYSYTAEVYSDVDCKNLVTEFTFGEKAQKGNSSFYKWHTGEFEVADEGTYYVRVKANGNKENLVEDSEYSDVVEIQLSADVDDTYSLDITIPENASAYDLSGLNCDFIYDLMWHKGFTNGTENDLLDGEFLDFTLTQTEGNGETTVWHLMEDGTLYIDGPSQIPVDLVVNTGTWTKEDDGSLSVHVDITDYNTTSQDELSDESGVKGAIEIKSGWGQ